MTESNFLAMHSGVVDLVVCSVQKSIQGNIRQVECRKFAKKAVQKDFEVEIPDPNVPQPSTSQEFDGTKPKVQRTERGKGRGKGRGRGQKSIPTEVVQPVPVQPVQSVQKLDMMTQTDSDFEEYLVMSEQEFEEYQMFKEKKLMQQYLVSTIQEEDFQDYDPE